MSGVFIGLGIGFTIFVVVSIISCIMRKRKRVRGQVLQAPVVVTSATHTAPGVYPPSVQNVTVYPTAQTGYQQSPYPQQAPYPVSGVPTAMPMPMPQTHMQVNPMSAQNQMMPPYPPAGGFTMNPPSYESAVGPNQPGYEKQAPYNPGYTTGY